MQTLVQVNADIDSAIPDAPNRNVTPGSLRALLKKVTTYVDDLTKNKLSAWLNVANDQPSLNASENVYRTGKVNFRGGAAARMLTTNPTPWGGLGYNSFAGLQIENANGGPAFIEFHNPGVRADQLGIDTDGILKLRPYASAVAYPVVINGLTTALGIGTNTPRRALDVNGEIVATSRLTLASDTGQTTPTWHIDNNADLFRVFRQPTIAGGGGLVCMTVTNTGFMALGVGNAAGTSQLHVKGATGHQQLRLETSYTPTSTNDLNGMVGQVAWDANYWYVKTAMGWKRTSLTTF